VTGLGIALGLLAVVAPFAWLTFGRIPDVQAPADRGHGYTVGLGGAPLRRRPERPTDANRPVPRHPYRS